MLMYLGLFAFVYSVSAQIPRYGNCNPNIPVVQDFDISSYIGTWYENERYFFIPEVLLKCSQANYSLNDDGSVKVINSGQNIITGRKSRVEGRAVAPDQSEPAKLEVNFSRFAPPGPYWVLDTDYDNYAVVYSCTNLLRVFPLRTEVTWILTRSPSGVTDDVKQQIYDLLSQNGINPNSLKPTDQTGCNA